jgi:4-amino-4-deoxy-L-arabinose transferase-like glycosyltransferase
VNQLWERYTTHVHHRGGPPWYFAGVLLSGALPWTPALLAGCARLWRERRQAEARLLGSWLLAPLIFFSFSGSKLPAYLLPCLPAMAMIAALGIGTGGRAVHWSGAVLLAGLAGAGWAFGPHALGRAIGLVAPGTVSLPLPAQVGLVCLAYAATWLARARPVPAAVLVVLGVTALFVALAPYDGLLGSPRAVARVLAENRSPGEPVVEFARFNAGLPFYLGEPVRLLEVPRETTFEHLARPGNMFVTRDSLKALATLRGRVWLLGPRGATSDLASSLGLKYQGITRWKDQALGFVSR